ncbi:MAG: Soluble lytic murein transglycosylase precursor [Micavibrio sp.]|nr:Soluble lytic murein transglycosylase precursor [Micavibrio sp.]
MSDSDKAATIRAIQGAQQRKWPYAEAQIRRTVDPLAPKIFYWIYYTEAQAPFQFNRITAFVRQVPDWPQQGTMRLNAEKSINDSTPPDEITRWFDQFPPLTAEGMNRYLRALIAQKQMKQMTSVINAWWGDANLTSDQQDQFLKTYGRLINKEAHKRRFNTALYRGQVGNARAIALILGHGYISLAEARIALAAGQSGVDRLVEQVPTNLRNDPDLQLERLRWRRKKNLDFEAMDILHNAPPSNLIANPDAWWKERGILTRRLIERRQYESAYLLVKKHGLTTGESFSEAEFLSGWLALRFMKKPWDAFQHFENLYHNSVMPLTRARAAYWAGMASIDLKHPEIAKLWFESGAKYPTTFYGQMSMARLGRHTENVAANPPMPVPLRVEFENDKRIQAARLFIRAGDDDNASAFLRAYISSATTQAQFYMAAELASTWQHPNDLVAIAKKALVKGVVMSEYAFPTILGKMKSVDAEWALVHGLIRQESAFDYKAVSPVGARGLMQLMPATAKELAQKNGVGYDADWLTERPDYNIKLGALYINKMLARYDNCYPLAIAAYNAGPGRASQWLAANGNPCTGQVNMVDWIEMIPVGETRNYVQRVLEGVYIYRQKFSKVQKANLPIHVSYEKQLVLAK